MSAAPRVTEIQRVAIAFYGLPPDAMTIRRSKRHARPRQVAMYCTRVATQLSLPQIGRAFGGRDHTTVLHAVRRVHERAETSQSLRVQVNALLFSVGISADRRRQLFAAVLAAGAIARACAGCFAANDDAPRVLVPRRAMMGRR